MLQKLTAGSVFANSAAIFQPPAQKFTLQKQCVFGVSPPPTKLSRFRQCRRTTP